MSFFVELLLQPVSGDAGHTSSGEPEPVDETWGRLRHLGTRRDQLIVTMTSQVQQMRPLLECVWPAALDTAKQPFRSRTWLAALTVVCYRDGDDLDRTRRLGADRFERAIRREVARRGGLKPSPRITRALFAALTDPAGVIGHRRGALERVRFLPADRDHAGASLAEVESLMTGVEDELGLTALVDSITGLSVLGAAAILAETSDPNRFASAWALVKHAGLAPREKSPGTFTGRTKLTGQGSPEAASGGMACGLGSPTRQPRLRHSLSALDRARDQPAHPDAGSGGHRRDDPAAPARRHHHRPELGPRHRHPRPHTGHRGQRGLNRATAPRAGRGEPHAAWRHPWVISTLIMGSPSRRHQPDHALPGPPPCRYAGNDDKS
ncbi:transposase [Umezawaea sp. Da 62-37]|uniref:transposase n=1 Tax=Umezawaea sp. Da 62-37 TaxID=3075927 RepID=UPI0028F74C37|nr:transposase [Umezawaea sp. Da 62-37]WNV85217.1 transposase [Umezawaea sp. Da 62-37]